MRWFDRCLGTVCVGVVLAVGAWLFRVNLSQPEVSQGCECCRWLATVHDREDAR